jgi:hypothetical protein
VVVNPVKLAELLRGHDGPVVRRLIEDGEAVKDEAKRLVGVYVPPDAYSAANRSRRPGTLRDSIVKRIVTDGGNVAVEVGSDDPIALWHHEGTQPHTITPSIRPMLVFYWKRVGKVVRALMVRHPGTKPNRFLLDALRVLRGRY